MFQRKSLENAQTLLNPAKAKDLDGHQLVQSANVPEISSRMILDLGEQLLLQVENFKKGIIFPNHQLPSQELLRNLMSRGNDRFFAKLMLGGNVADQYLSTGQVVTTPNGSLVIELQVLPVSLQMLQKSNVEKHTDQTRLLAAAALSASALPDSLRRGLETTQCSTKVNVVSSVTPDHSGPLATVFEQFVGMNGTYSTLQPVTGSQNPTLADMTHLHGVATPVANEARLFASRSGIAAGMELVTVRLDVLSGKFALNVMHRDIEGVGREIVTIKEQFPQILRNDVLAQTSAALGFTAHIIGDDKREAGVERTFDKANAAVPMRELLSNIR